jgi:hypothetical protein
MTELAGWADEMRQLFRAGSTSQFLLYGAVDDLVPGPEVDGRRSFTSLRRFLTEVMFEPFDVVIHYDRGRGIRVPKGGDHFHRFLRAFDAFQGTSWAKIPDLGPGDTALDLGNLLPREASRALELINRFMRGSQGLTESDESGRRVAAPLKVAVLLGYAHFIAPRGDALHMSGERSQVLIQLLEWASDPAILGAFVATVLITENLADVNRMLVESPHSAKVKIPLPDAAELRQFVGHVTAGEPDFDELSELSREALADRLVGLSRVNVRRLLRRALRNRQPLDQRYLADLRKELIEKQAAGLIEFIESKRTLDDVAGHVEAKEWLRQDAELLRRGSTRAIPMGYLLAGRIGTGKTFLVNCLAGEVGIPVVELKNFRDRWVGATEGNLETVFNILHALGQVIVFVDEADQATGKREGGLGDSGLSGRVYGMLAKEMSDTDNRGKILWIFATSRPDLLEVDLKRQGRLDVHIPLFPPHDAANRHDLFYAMARKVDNDQIGGNEMEGILVRALRIFATREDGDEAGLPEVIRRVVAGFRPSAHTDRLELMDLLAVKECTDDRFLPPRFRGMSLDRVNERIAELQLRIS